MKKFSDPSDGLCWAARKGYRDSVAMYMSQGADDWNLALWEAARSGHCDLVELFISRGATEWEVPFNDACLRGHFAVVKTFMSHRPAKLDYDKALASASYMGHRDIVDYLISRELAHNVNWALNEAARGNQREIVDLLISNGASDWDMARYQANKGGHHELAAFFNEQIEKRDRDTITMGPE